MSIATIQITKKCSCENPKVELFEVKRVKSGKRFGEKRFTYRCANCRAIWKTFKEI